MGVLRDVGAPDIYLTQLVNPWPLSAGVLYEREVSHCCVLNYVADYLIYTSHR